MAIKHDLKALARALDLAPDEVLDNSPRARERTEIRELFFTDRDEFVRRTNEYRRKYNIKPEPGWWGERLMRGPDHAR